MKILNLSVLALCSLLTGCSSFLNIGSPEYSCKGLPTGAQCASARDIYEETNNGNVPLTLGDKSSEQTIGTIEKTESFNPSSKLLNNYVPAHTAGQPIPIRTPAQVMRIWISPWEDKNGDLIMPGFIYTEIEPRRWVVGEKEDLKNNNFKLIK